MSSSSVHKLVLLSLFTALVTVGTMVIQIPTPGTQGYINFGDTLIFLAGIILGPFSGLLAGGLGSALADLLSGYAHYAPWTLLIKGTEGLVVGLLVYGSFRKRRTLLMPILGMLVAGAIMIFGYYGAEAFMYDTAGALANIPGNAVQAVGSIVMAAALLLPLSKALNRYLD